MLTFEHMFDNMAVMGAITGQVRPVAGAAGEVLRAVHRALDDLVVAADDPDPRGAIVEVDRAIARLQARRLDLVRTADRADVSSASGASGTVAWLAAATRA